MLVVGGGCGGCAIASKLTRKLGNQEIIILEPSNVRISNQISIMENFISSRLFLESLLSTNVHTNWRGN